MKFNEYNYIRPDLDEYKAKMDEQLQKILQLAIITLEDGE